MGKRSVVIAVGMNTSSAEQSLAKLKEKIQEAEKELEGKQNEQSGIEKKLNEAKAASDETRASIRKMKEELAAAQAALNPSTTPGVDLPFDKFMEYQDAVKTLPSRIYESTRLVSAQDREVEKLEKSYKAVSDQVDKAKSKLDGLKFSAGNLQKQIDAEKSQSVFKGMGDAIDGARSKLEKFTKRVGRLAQRVLVFSLVTRALRTFRDYMGKVIKTDAEASASVARLKAALLTLVQPLVEVILPAVATFLNFLTRAILVIARLVSVVFGKTLEQSASSAQALYAQSEAAEETAESYEDMGNAAKKAGKYFAGFDEINVLGSDENVSAGTLDVQGTGAGEGWSSPDFAGMMSGSIDALTEFLLGTASLAVGAILTFSGINIPLGITLMAIGAAAIYDAVQTDWAAIVSGLQGPYGAIMLFLGSAFLIIGAILAFSGANIPLGIALMAVGALGMGTAIAVNWDTIRAALEDGPIRDLTIALGVAFLVVGAILTFSGANIPLGIALMAVGALGMGTAIAVNWDTIRATLEDGPIKDLAVVLGLQLLVVGAVLAFSGAAIGLGIGLMAAGAAALGSVVAVNWDKIRAALEDGPIKDLAIALGAALLVIGAVLAFSGAAIGLGIGLMAAGAATLGTVAVVNWTSSSGKIKETLTDILRAIAAAAIVIGVILLLTGVSAPLGIGLIAAGAVALGGAAALNWNYLLDKIKGAWDAVKNWWNTNAAKYFTWDYWRGLGRDIVDGILDGIKNAWSSLTSWVSNAWNNVKSFFGFGSTAAPSSSVGGSVPSTYAQLPSLGARGYSPPRLAQGAVIPPNREFAAVLGDQKSGMNLEAPEALIRRIVREESGRNNTPKTITVIMECDRIQFGKVVYTLNNEEVQRVGVNLAEAAHG